MTKVIFRKYRDNGEIVAVFPYIPEDRRGALFGCSVYQHIGQHGAADYNAMIDLTKPADVIESQALMNELVAIGYDDLKIIKKRNHDEASKAR